MSDEWKIFEQIMLEKTISIQKLDGGFTNQNFLITAESGKYVLRIPGKKTNDYINRSDEIENIKRLAQTGYVPDLFYANPGTGIIISRYIENNMPVTIDLLKDSKICLNVNNSLVEIHNSGIELQNEIDILSTKSLYIDILKGMNVVLPVELEAHITFLDKAVDLLFTKYPKELTSCHGDPKLNNFLLQNDKIYLIDWEYSGMADCYFDLVNLVMTNNMQPEMERLMIETYERCSGRNINKEKYILYKIAIDYMYIYWHLIKLFDNEMVEYNAKSWRNRLNRAICNMRKLGMST